MTTFTDNVWFALEQAEMTVQDLANACGIARPNLSKILHGKEGISIERAERIADALSVELSTLLKPNKAAAKI